MGERVLAGAALAALGIEAFRSYQVQAFPPPPSAFFFVAVAFSMLALLSIASAQVAAALGVAVDVGLLIVSFGGKQETALAPRSSARQGGLAT